MLLTTFTSSIQLGMRQLGCPGVTPPCTSAAAACLSCLPPPLAGRWTKLAVHVPLALHASTSRSRYLAAHTLTYASLFTLLTHTLTLPQSHFLAHTSFVTPSPFLTHTSPLHTPYSGFLSHTSSLTGSCCSSSASQASCRTWAPRCPASHAWKTEHRFRVEQEGLVTKAHAKGEPGGMHTPLSLPKMYRAWGHQAFRKQLLPLCNIIKLVNCYFYSSPTISF